ncbi:hypothetical protein SUTMEG_16980 [Sutterella megalosphaeroides]|uniref:Uncharacterized protein n=1 Tax=Sutterella megalosphaeroides TaxID=2494234 RepID=A0A2Z6IDX0_9BURK|nr:hypothetical protein SUTMEG_16980 [Sutterella megalosphaeroides]
MAVRTEFGGIGRGGAGKEEGARKKGGKEGFDVHRYLRWRRPKGGGVKALARIPASAAGTVENLLGGSCEDRNERGGREKSGRAVRFLSLR